MPLASLLAPQIARKALELQQQLPPLPGAQPPPLAQGYLQQAGNPTRDNGMPKKDMPAYDPRMLDANDSAAIAQGAMLKSPNPGVRATGHSYMQRTLPSANVAPMPNASAPAPAPAAAPRKGPLVIKLDPNEAVAQTEGGVQLDRRGKKLGGYLEGGFQGARDAQTPLQALNRRPADLNLDAPLGNIVKDRFARSQLDEMYGGALKAMQDNRDPNGMPTDKFPDGFFDGKPKAYRENIKQGVEVLRKVQKLEATDTGMGIPVRTI